MKAGSFADRHVIVTGGSSGIGRAVAARFAAEGACVTIIARRAELLQSAADDIARCSPEGSSKVLAVPADVTRPDQLAAAIDHAVDTFGTPDVLVCCAGVARPDYFSELGLAHFTDAMNTNYYGTLHAIRCVLGGMRQADRGHLVLMSSGAALIGLFGYAAYGPSKFAVRGLAETLRAELAGTQVRVSVVYPPDVDTPQLAQENLTKPAELRAISAGAKAWTAERAAEVIFRGVARGSFVITGGVSMRLLVYGHSVLAPLLFRLFDGLAAKGHCLPIAADTESMTRDRRSRSIMDKRCAHDGASRIAKR
jgi:3-dehydrosphinganine reductase